LTAQGRRVFGELDAKARDAIAALLHGLCDPEQAALVRAMSAVEALLTRPEESSAPSPAASTVPASAVTTRDVDRDPAVQTIILRAHRPGDMGTIVAQQAELYAREYGWNHEYEALTARIVSDFLGNFDATRESCWVAERAGELIGSVFLVKHPEREHTARLRMLHVAASARGSGIGRRLVRECTDFARRAGYRTITLWTNSVLVSARRIYEAEGYKLVDEKPQRNFGRDLISQTWELAL